MLDFMIIQRPRIKKYQYQIQDLEITRLIEKRKEYAVLDITRIKRPRSNTLILSNTRPRNY